MLSELYIRNFALIEDLTLSFGPEFNVLTGETGAGKSIIIGAISLILGGRASMDLIRQGADEAEVTALFHSTEPESFALRLESLGMIGTDEILVRRVISRSGRHRLFINGSPATLSQLAVLSRELVAVSGQHEHQQLLDPDRQLLFLDQFAGLLKERVEMNQAYERLADLEARAADLSRRIAQARERAELFQFQAQEIEAAEIVLGEDDELEKERSLIRNAEKIYSNLKQAHDRLYGESGAVLGNLRMVRDDLGRAAALDERLTGVLAQVEEAFHQLDDAADVLGRHLDKLTFDPERLALVEDRLAVLNRLKRKYGPTLDRILDFAREAAGHLDLFEDMNQEQVELASAVEATRVETHTLAAALSTARQAGSMEMSGLVSDELRALGMPQARFEIRFRPRPTDARPGPTGWDGVDFYFSANLGEEMKPLARVASGGELSRTMLGLKTLLAGQDRVDTVVFDEVDAGIGGAVAEVVGRKIKDLAGYHQIICITHLPQIAMYGRSHHLVYKEVKGQRTVTGIRPLSSDEKVEAIARMFGGLELTEAALAAAREMIVRGEG